MDLFKDLKSKGDYIVLADRIKETKSNLYKSWKSIFVIFDSDRFIDLVN